jgi:hypothetical protein
MSSPLQYTLAKGSHGFYCSIDLPYMSSSDQLQNLQRQVTQLTHHLEVIQQEINTLKGQPQNDKVPS